MRILLTGFQPFDGASTNPSWEAVSLLPPVIAGATLDRLLLPVTYGEAGQLVLAHARATKPDIVICTGVASGRKAVTPELVAVNWRMASIPDNAGQHFSGELIDPDAPAALMTQLPAVALVDAVKAAGIPCQLSLSAGAYVCNDVYWHALSGQEEGGWKALFVHVPAAEDLPVAQTAEALTALIATLTQYQHA